MTPDMDGADLIFDGAPVDEAEGPRLHAACLLHMSYFMVDPTATRAALVATLLDALSRHVERFESDCGCDLYQQARSIWLRVARHVGDSEQASAVAPVRH